MFAAPKQALNWIQLAFPAFLSSACEASHLTILFTIDLGYTPSEKENQETGPLSLAVYCIPHTLSLSLSLNSMPGENKRNEETGVTTLPCLLYVLYLPRAYPVQLPCLFYILFSHSFKFNYIILILLIFIVR